MYFLFDEPRRQVTENLTMFPDEYQETAETDTEDTGVGSEKHKREVISCFF